MLKVVGPGRNRGMLLALLAVVAVALPAGAARPVAVAAASCHSITVGHSATITLNGSNAYTASVCPGAASQPAVLDFRAATTTAQDFALCLFGADGKYVRSSHLTLDQHLQRVAVLTPFRHSTYVAEINACDTFGSPIGTFTLTVSYAASPASNGGNGFAFATQHLPIAATSSAPGSGEPSIAVDALHGDRVYISAPVGIPSGAGCVFDQTPKNCNGINFWFSENAGSTFTFCNPSLPNGGGDSHVALDPTGSIYGADLAASNVDVQKLPSTSSGPPVPNPAATSCGFQNATPTAAASDREWLATHLSDASKGTNAAQLYLSYHDLAAQMVWECVGNQSGGTPIFDACQNPVITDGTTFVNSLTSTINGNQVFDSKGNIYSIFGVSTAQSNVSGNGTIHNLYVGVSSDGHTFTDHGVFVTQSGGDNAGTKNLANIFPVIGIDRGDNLYAVWSQAAQPGAAGTEGGANIELSSSTDHGVHWSSPVRVNSTSLKSNVLPWVVGGADGRIDVVWAGSSTATKPADVNGTWNIYLAQSANATSSTPAFTQGRVSPQPVRYGWMCTQGILCAAAGDDGRILLDFVSVALDSKCMANITYGDFGPDTSALTTRNGGGGFFPYTDYARQTAGSSLCPSSSSSGSTSSGSGAVSANQTGLPFTGGAGQGLPLVAVATVVGGLLLLGAGLAARIRKES